MLNPHCYNQSQYSPSSPSQRPNVTLDPSISLNPPHPNHWEVPLGRPPDPVPSLLMTFHHDNLGHCNSLINDFLVSIPASSQSILHKPTRTFFLKGELEQVTSCCKFSNGIQSSWNKILTPPLGLGGPRGSDLKLLSLHSRHSPFLCFLKPVKLGLASVSLWQFFPQPKSSSPDPHKIISFCHSGLSSKKPPRTGFPPSGTHQSRFHPLRRSLSSTSTYAVFIIASRQILICLLLVSCPFPFQHS